MNATNSSVVVQDGVPIYVEQGPGWLAELLYSPPAHLDLVIGLVILAGLVFFVHQLIERGVDVEEFEAMVQNVLSLVFCGGLTWWLVQHADFPYVLDVSVGVSVGFVLALLGRLIAERVIEGDEGAGKVGVIQ